MSRMVEYVCRKSCGLRVRNRALRDGGIPTFPSLERGAQAMKNALDYHYLQRDNGK